MKKFSIVLFILLWSVIFCIFPPINNKIARKSIKAQEYLEEKSKDINTAKESNLANKEKDENKIILDENASASKENPNDEENKIINKDKIINTIKDNNEEKNTINKNINAEKDASKGESESLLKETSSNKEVLKINPEENNEHLIGFSPYFLSDTNSKGGFISTDSQKYEVTGGDLIYADVIWTWERRYDGVFGTIFRQIHYSNGNGKEYTAPFYCMRADQKGWFNGTNREIIKENSLEYINDYRIQRILYYGYGGIKDITSTFDPTKGKGNWGNWQNRYIFTHMALSYIYSGQLNNAREDELKYYGFYDFVNKLINTPIPERDNVQFRIYGDKTQGQKNANIDCHFWPKIPETLNWLKSELKDKVFVSPKIEITSSIDDNGINIYCPNNAKWIMGYWTSNEDLKTRGINNPRILQKGGKITLLKGSSFKIAFSHENNNTVSFAFDIKKNPVKFLVVNGNSQAGYDGNFQNFGAVVYELNKAKTILNLKPMGYGLISITKIDSKTKKSVEGGVYSLYAKDDISIGKNIIYKKGELISKSQTDQNGRIDFNYLLEGEYIIRESKINSPLYKLDTKPYLCNVKSGLTTYLNVKEDKYLKGKLILTKEDEATKEKLEGAEFTIFEYSKRKSDYIKKDILKYNSEAKEYNYDLNETDDNCGKFKVVETKSPDGYKGSFQKEFVLNSEKIEIIATNKKIEKNKYDLVIGKSLREDYKNISNGLPIFIFDVVGTTTDNEKINRQIIIKINDGNYSETIIKALPEGIYYVKEEPCLLYKNISIKTEGNNESISGDCCKVDLNKNSKVIFVNKKRRDDGFTHNDLVTNSFNLK